MKIKNMKEGGKWREGEGRERGRKKGRRTIKKNIVIGEEGE